MDARHKKPEGQPSAAAAASASSGPKPVVAPVPSSLLGDLISGKKGSMTAVQKVYDYAGVEGLKAMKSTSKENLVVIHDYYHPSQESGFSFRPLLFMHFQIEHCYSPKDKVSGAFLELMQLMYGAALRNEPDRFLHAAADLPTLVPASEHKLLRNIAARFFGQNQQHLCQLAEACVNAPVAAQQTEYAQRITRKMVALNWNAKTSVATLGLLSSDEKSILTPPALLAKAQYYLVRATNLKDAFEHLASADKEKERNNVLSFLKAAISKLMTDIRNFLALPEQVAADQSKLDLLSTLNPLMKQLFDMASELVNQLPDVTLKARAQEEIKTKINAAVRDESLFRAAVKAKEDAIVRAAMHNALGWRH